MPPGVLCYGSLGPDLIHQLPRLPLPGDDLPSTTWQIAYGGSAANTAVPLVAWGAPSRVLGHRLGDDPLAGWLLGELAHLGVDVGLVESREGAPTPHCVVLLTPDGERTIVSTGYQQVGWQVVPEAGWAGTAVVLVDGYSGAAGAAVAGQARVRDIPVVGLDVAEAAHVADWVIWSRHEHPDPGEAQRLAAGGRTVMVTDGPREVLVRRGREVFQLEPPQLGVRDPTGAGDICAAMCAFGILHRWDWVRTIRAAIAAASLLAAAGRGSGVPSLEPIESTAGQLQLVRMASKGGPA